jgi:hypothetical protein
MIIITERHLRRWTAGLLGVTGLIVALSTLSFHTIRGTGRQELYAYLQVGSELGLAAYWNAALLALVSNNPFPTNAWVVVGVPLAALLVLWAATRPLPPTLKRGLGVALGLYILGALGFEALSGYWSRQERPGVSNVFATIEESLEVLACVLAIHVIARAWLPLRIVPLERRGAGAAPAGDSPSAPARMGP